MKQNKLKTYLLNILYRLVADTGTWSDRMLNNWAEQGGLTPFEPKNINPASVDLRIGNKFINLTTGQKVECSKIRFVRGMGVECFRDDHKLIDYWQTAAILATTVEYVRLPPSASGVLYLKSSMARQGLDHSLAGWIDPGFEGEITLELHAHRPLTLEAGQRVIQLVLSGMAERPLLAYGETGRYQGQRGPTASRPKRFTN